MDDGRFCLSAVIHCDPSQTPVIEHEAAGFDYVHGDAEAGCQAKDCAGILRDIRLIKGDTHDEGIALSGESRNRTCFQRLRQRINAAFTL